MKKKRESLDCVAVKRRAQQPLARALAGKSPEAQVETLQRLAAKTPLWKRLVKPPAAARSRGKRRSIA
jgi:hypothetical protein